MSRSNAEKREAIRSQLRRTPGESDNAIATLVGVSPHTVKKIRAELVENAEIRSGTVTRGRDTRQRRVSDEWKVPGEAVQVILDRWSVRGSTGTDRREILAMLERHLDASTMLTTSVYDRHAYKTDAVFNYLTCCCDITAALETVKQYGSMQGTLAILAPLNLLRYISLIDDSELDDLSLSSVIAIRGVEDVWPADTWFVFEPNYQKDWEFEVVEAPQ